MTSHFIGVVVDRQIGPDPGWTVIIALLAGMVFGVLGFRVRGNWTLWALGGALSTLLTALILASLADATALPYTDEVKNHRKMIALVLTVAIIGLVGLAVAFHARGPLRKEA
jgi:RsiW-degrading membrane proteinase PrsW (M82 family)